VPRRRERTKRDPGIQVHQFGLEQVINVIMLEVRKPLPSGLFTAALEKYQQSLGKNA